MSAFQEFLNSVRSLFRQEAAEAADLMAEVKDDLEADLDAREARLDETPMEAIERLQDEIADSDDLDEIRRRLNPDT
jgi:ElaB/YqjD/DUF883 family membrane-anchored ribosome-binding protein